ncbi:DNA-packaging protein [Lutimaribacter saemankumensis]|uniref:Large terminase phage packaging protein n=1 Tax=Lutimaribacter saemankumensis TaxID=490829 RepID=A0A1G8HMC3_9RHOB|nr:terminase family protein [Lutimaribacter saemankumensis]SDI07808.1 Large terminase phage packaging protein [Lutimaribacter saemankumensis]
MPSISTGHELRSGAAWLASAPEDVQQEFLESLDDEMVLALPHLFEFWALPHQLPPDGDWRTWVILGGRGAGKTRAGAEWVRGLVEGAMPLDPGRCARVAIVGETLDQAREVMVFGDSGILACAPPDRKPVWHGGRRMLTWPNGATAQVFSAHEPEALRGPQFDAAWVDELAKWKRGQEAWDMLQFALRLGDRPQVCVTTTPRNVGVLKDLLERESTVQTHAATEANAANLGESFMVEMRARYAGTRLGRQELEGILMEDAEGALWSRATLDAARVREVPELDRIVVAVDPPVTGHSRSDECGIVVAGVRSQGGPQHWQACVLEDASVSAASPDAWARAAIAAKERWRADRIVVEVNQGGDMVEAVLRQVDPLVPLSKVRASVNKQARAEPVAALYEQRRVNHLRGFGVLEDQMCAMTTLGFEGTGSPDRLDALVWAMTDLMIEPARKWRHPQVRAL